MIRWEKYFGCNLLSGQFFWGFPSEPIIREVIMHATERQFSFGEIDQGGIVQVEIMFGAIIRGTIIWGQQFVGNYPGGNFHGGLLSGEAIFCGATIIEDNFPGDNHSGGNYLGSNFFQGQLSGYNWAINSGGKYQNFLILIFLLVAGDKGWTTKRL